MGESHGDCVKLETSVYAFLLKCYVNLGYIAIIKYNGQTHLFKRITPIQQASYDNVPAPPIFNALDVR